MQKVNNVYIHFFFFTFFILFLFNELGHVSARLIADNYNIIIVIITLFIVMFLNLINFQNSNRTLIIYLNFIILFSIFIIFFTNNFIIFYILFELSVIPLIFYIRAWGYSLERFKAIMYIFVYTLFFSLHFLMIIVITRIVSNNTLLTNISNFNINFIKDFFLLLYPIIFLVKVPMWGFHFWLPKAHVEASTEGSILLAGIVLKLGGIGIVKFSYINNTISLNNNFLNYIFMSLCILGALIITFICLRQTDSKIIVAISSIVHMSFIYLCYTYFSNFSIEVLFLVIIAHGFVSPLIFFFVNMIYEKINSRSLFFTKRIIKNVNYLIATWFIICILNIGIPLRINFLSELTFFFSTINFNFIILIFAILLVFINGVFNIFLYSYYISGQTNNYIFNQTKTLHIFLLNSITLFVIFFFIFC